MHEPAASQTEASSMTSLQFWLMLSLQISIAPGCIFWSLSLQSDSLNEEHNERSLTIPYPSLSSSLHAERQEESERQSLSAQSFAASQSLSTLSEQISFWESFSTALQIACDPSAAQTYVPELTHAPMPAVHALPTFENPSSMMPSQSLSSLSQISGAEMQVIA